MSTYQDRARLVIRKYREMADLAWSDVIDKVHTVEEYNKANEWLLDQALSELASIVEEEIIGKDELQGMYTPLQWEIAQDRNALRAKQRDQLSNRRKSDE